MFISPLRRFTSIIALGVLVLMLVGGWWVTRPARLSRLAGVLLSEVLGGNVEIRSARLSMSGTIVLRGVVLRTAPGDDPALTVFTADELEVRFDWLSLLSGHLDATQITAVRAALHLTEYASTGEWNYQRLFRAPPAGSDAPSGSPPAPPVLPVIVLREAALYRAETAHGHFSRTSETVIDGHLVPSPSQPALYVIRVMERPAPGAREKPVEVAGEWDVANNVFTATVNAVPLSESLRQSLPRQAREIWDTYAPVGQLKSLKITMHPKTGPLLKLLLENVGISLVLDERMLPTTERFPIALRKVRGEVDIGLADGAVRFRRLDGDLAFIESDGTVLSFPFTARGEMQETGPGCPYWIELSFRDAVVGLDPRVPRRHVYPRVAYVIPQSRDLIERITPRGRINLQMKLARGSWNGPVEAKGSVDCTDLSIRFPPFPFPIHNMRGPILFTNDVVTFGNPATGQVVTGVADEGDGGLERMNVEISGAGGLTWENQFVDFLVTSKNAVFDERAAACMPEKYRKIWDQFSPRFRGGFSCRIVRVKDAPNVSTTVGVDVEDGQARFEGLPYDLRNISGRLQFTDDLTTLDLKARGGLDNSAHLAFKGKVRHTGGDVENLLPDVVVTARNVSLDAELLSALPPEKTQWRSKLDVSGKIDADATIKTVAGGKTEYVLDLALRAGGLRTRDGVYALHDVAAKARVTPLSVALLSLTGKAGEHATVAVTGAYAADLTLDVAAAWSGFPVGAQPPAFVPAEQAALWRSFRPVGTVDGKASAKIKLDGAALAALTSPAPSVPAMPVFVPGVGNVTLPAPDLNSAAGGASVWSAAVTSYTIDISTAELSLSPADWPMPVEKIKGAVKITPERVEASGISAAAGKMALALSSLSYERASGGVTLSGSAESPEWPGPWLTLLGRDAAAAIQSQKPEGDIALAIKSLSRPGEGKPWAFSGALASRSVKIATGSNGSIPVAMTGLALSADGTWDPSRPPGEVLAFKGDFKTESTTLQGRELQNLRAVMVCEKSAVAFGDLDAAVAGGKFQGKVTVRYDDPLRYEGSLVLSGADLPTLLLPPGATKEERAKIGTGKVTATLAVQEQFGKHPDRTGRGELAVKGGKLYDVPLAMGLMQLATLRLPVSSAFDSATMSYYIRDNKVTFERILLESPGINLAGLGTMTVSDRVLDMTFVTQSPRELHILLISDIVNWTRNELLQIHVTGAVETPTVKPVPLSTLAGTLEKLLPKRK